MHREDFIYSDEATILVSPNDVCLVHQIIAPVKVTPETLESAKADTGDSTIEVGKYIGRKEDVLNVYMTHAHAKKLIEALTTALKVDSDDTIVE